MTTEIQATDNDADHLYGSGMPQSRTRPEGQVSEDDPDKVVKLTSAGRAEMSEASE